MKATFNIGRYAVKIESFYFEPLFYNVICANKERLNSIAVNAHIGFIKRLKSIWHDRNFKMISLPPIIDNHTNIEPYFGNQIILAAWLTSSICIPHQIACGSQAFIVWYHDLANEIDVKKVIANIDWEGIAEPFDF
ncbi:MAG: hypothetical protein ACOYL3_17450 [Desulfuromonadaceae bacterium]